MVGASVGAPVVGASVVGVAVEGAAVPGARKQPDLPDRGRELLP